MMDLEVKVDNSSFHARASAIIYNKDKIIICIGGLFFCIK